MRRRLTIIESPYAASDTHSIDDHAIYLRRCLRDSWDRGELPFASHGFFPTFLNENDPAERAAGIEAGYAFWDYQQSVVVFYVDLGMSRGMRAALKRCGEVGQRYEIRTLTGFPNGKTRP